MIIRAQFLDGTPFPPFEATPWLEGNQLLAKLPDSDMVATLHCEQPALGWLIYPN